MATIVQSNYVVTDAFAPVSIALNSAATPGNTIVLAIGWQDASAAGLPVPSNANGTWQAVFSPTLSGHLSAVSVFYVPNCAAGTHSSSIQGPLTPPDTNFFATVAIYEIAGLLASPLDAVSPGGATDNGGAGQTSQATGSTGTLAQPNEFAFVAMSFDDSPGVTNEGIVVPSGYTVDPNIPASFQNTASNIGLQIGWKELTSTAAINPSFTWASQSGLSSTFAVAATFKELVSSLGIQLGARGPGRSPSKSRFQQFKLSTTVQSTVTINSSIGAYSWSGTISTASSLINEGVGGYSWLGTTATINDVINAIVGSYTWSGTTSVNSGLINAVVGSYSWASTTSTASGLINAAVGAYSWSGTTSNISGPIAASVGAYAWSGTTATASQFINSDGGASAYSWAGTTSGVSTQSQGSSPVFRRHAFRPRSLSF